VPTDRIELFPGVVTVPMVTPTLPPATHTNCYLVGERECLLVDPGSGEPEAQALLARKLEMLAEEGRRPIAIAVTHSHPDHTAGVEALRRRLDVPVWTHPRIAGELGADRALSDGEILSLDGRGRGPWKLEVLFTPGHARDHVAFFERQRGVLLVGDMVSGLSTVVIDPPEGDLSDYLASLRRLMELPARSLFPGHGPPGGGARERLAQLVEHRLWRHQRVIDALRDRPASLDDLLPGVYSDVAQSQWPWARRSLLAHLQALEREGRARRDAHPGAAEAKGPGDEHGVWRAT
jgi:glyoxylase-like metal-dependent hydrolase (beta-lactamase superfamily II)